MSAETSSRTGLRVVLSIVLALGLLGLGAAVFKRLSVKAPPTRADTGVDLPPLIRVRAAVREDYQEQVRVYGIARANHRVPVVAEVGGVLSWMDPELEVGRPLEPLDASPASRNGRAATEGGSDGPGERADDDNRGLIARIDSRDVKDRIERATAERAALQGDLDRILRQRSSLEARLAIAREDLDTAERDRDRIAKLVPRTLPRSDLDNQLLQVTARRSQITLLEGNLDDNEASQVALRARLDAQAKSLDLEDRAKARHLIGRPRAGVIARRLVDRGDSVNPGQLLIELVDLSLVEVPLAVPAGHYPYVNVGDTVTLLDPRDGRTLVKDATIARKAPGIDAARRTFEVFVDVVGTPTTTPVPPGTHVRADLGSQVHKNVVAVPRQALLDGDVFVARPVDQIGDQEVFEVEVRKPTFARLLPGAALIRTGLEADDLFLLTNLESVAGGTRIRIERDIPTAEEANARAPGDDTAAPDTPGR